MRLLELIPTPEADPELIAAVTHFCDAQLGKGVVMAKDTPNFIGNRIGTFSVLNVMRLMQEMDLSVEEVDALTGQAVGWPRSATFRTIDLVGLDVLGHVVGNMTQNVRDERSELQIPAFFRQMIEHKWLGDKTKGGFYKKVKSAGKEDERMAINWKTLEYRPRQKPKFAAIRQRLFFGVRSPICGLMRPIAFLRFLILSWRSIRRCGTGSAGNLVPLNCGTRREWKQPWDG
jgi:3-hydroxyacyl-CoA dehydrogenase